jgi:hypothetical protein
VNARQLVTAVAVIALVAPTAAAARLVPSRHPVHPVKRVVKHAVAPRVLCICVTGIGTQPLASEAELEAQIDQDLIAHGLDPVYGTASPTTAG